MELIDKAAIVAEIERRKKKNEEWKNSCKGIDSLAASMVIQEDINILSFLDTLEVKEVDLNNGIQLTWEDIRELYIIFAEVDVEIELCKSDNIKSETIGYYQEVLKRFKTQKGE